MSTYFVPYRYNWHDALWMYEKAQELAVPFMAGSSLVNCYRNPYLEHDFDAPIEEAIAVGFSGLDICKCSGELCFDAASQH